MSFGQNQLVEVTLEVAYEEAVKLTDRREQHTDTTTIIQGMHPVHGQVVIIIPPMGQSMVLPVVPLMITHAEGSPLLMSDPD